MSDFCQSDSVLNNATNAITDLAHYLETNVHNRRRPSLRELDSIMAQVHHHLETVCMTISAIHHNREALHRLQEFEKEKAPLAQHFHQLDSDQPFYALKFQGQRLQRVLSTILLARKTKTWFWKALDEEYATVVTDLAGLKQPEPWSKALKKSLIGIGFGLGGLMPPDFDTMYLDDEVPPSRQRTVRWIVGGEKIG